MVTTYQLKTAIADGVFYIPVGNPSHLTGIFSVTAYSDEYQTPVNLTGGTINITITEDGFNYGSILEGVINYPLVEGYARPSYTGYCTKAKVDLSGLTGATNLVVRLHIGV